MRRKSALQTRLEAFQSLLGAHITVNDYGRSISHFFEAEQLYHHNEHCDYVKTHQGARKSCALFDNGALPAALKKTSGGIRKYCHGGYLELAVPVLVNGRVEGAVVAGPYASGSILDGDAPPLERSATELRSFEAAVPKNRDLYSGLASLPQSKIETFLEVLHSFADTIADFADQSPPIGRFDQDRRRRILWVLGHRYSGGFHLADLAADLNLSESRAGTVIREVFGKSFTELLQSYRLERVKAYLEQTLLPVSEVADLCGFSSANYMYRLFKKHIGLTPLSYRKSQQHANEA